MNSSFMQLVADAVKKFGSQAEAARRTGLSTAFISQTLRGRGPVDPHTTTWNAVLSALGREVIQDKSGSYPTTEDTRADTLKKWMLRCPSSVADVIYRTANIHGFEKDNKT